MGTGKLLGQSDKMLGLSMMDNWASCLGGGGGDSNSPSRFTQPKPAMTGQLFPLIPASGLEDASPSFIYNNLLLTLFCDQEGGRAEYLNSCKGFLQRHSDFLGTSPYFTGEHVSINKAHAFDSVCSVSQISLRSGNRTLDLSFFLSFRNMIYQRLFYMKNVTFLWNKSYSIVM